MGSHLSRRAAIAALGAAAGALTLAQSVAAQAVARAQPGPNPADVPEDPTKVQGKPPSELGSRSPFEGPRRLVGGSTSSRTPLDALDGIITPADLHYERHHGGVPTIDPSRHTLTVHGMVDRPTVFTLADLQRFPSVSRIMFLECSGNTSWAEGPETSTAQSLHGLTSTSDWFGVPVKTLLTETGVKPGAFWALAEGADAAVMTRSVPLEKLLDDALVAWGQNGEALRPEQGYPMRLLLPGWEGNINIKWLRRLELGDEAFMTREETSKYTDPMPDGTARQFTYLMEAKSTITWPTPAIGSLPGRGLLEIRGIAWSGRGKITRVEVSTDGGQSWGEARLEEPVLSIAHTRFRFPWSWIGDEAVLQSRAYDESGYVQPSRAQLVDVRGTRSIYHYNGIQSWKIAAEGQVTNVYA
jgi:sulfane dehydrogenase subunit SoxC